MPHTTTTTTMTTKLLDVPENLRNETESVLAQCSGNIPPTETLNVDTACHSCNVSAVQWLWEQGLCEIPPTPGFDSAVYIFYITILVVAVLGNSVVVYIVCSSEKMRTVTNYFIANLAIGDLCMAILCVPFSFISTLILKFWPFGEHLCVAVNYLQAVSVFVSAYTLVAISLDRYLAIIYPLRPRMTRCQAKVIIASVWILSLATTLPVAIFSRLVTPPVNFYVHMDRQVCTEDWGSEPSDDELRMAYSVALMLLQYFLPLTVLVFTYSRIAMVVWGKRTLGETPARVDRIARSKRKMTKMMVTVVMVYTLCWLPFNVLMVVRELWVVDSWPYMMQVWALFHWLAMSHTCYNPIILCWMNTKFRSGFCSLAYTLPCLRRWVDSWFFTNDAADLLKATTTYPSHQYPRSASSRLVTISLKDDTIIFKSRNMNEDEAETSEAPRHRNSSSSDSNHRLSESLMSEPVNHNSNQ